MKKERNIVSAEVFEPLDALCTNKDRTRVAVVGRTVTKVYQIFDNHFELRSDRSKPRKTMYFSGSIAWSQLKDNLIAAASSNGAIYVWDPESPQTMESYYKAHKQLATKVCFNEFNEHILVSGSKDSTVWLYDLRMAEPTTCFASNQDDSIRDIQFCMESKNQDTFVTAGDSGTIRFWDARKPDKALKEFIAHSSQVYSIALNPQIQSKNLIATAGRDKYIRIWDWSKSTPHYFYTVEMMAIVTRVSWCPDNSWHVACCFAPPSGFVSSDNTIYVWDIRRPYIPFASFDAHTKTCTDMSWPRYGNCPSFLSCGKDGKLIMNFIDNAHRPILYANTVAINAQSPLFDEIFVAVPSYRRKSSSALVDQSDPFRRKVPSTLFCTTPTDPFLMDGKALAYFGMNYKFIGASIDELCAHNGRVAEYIFKDRLAYAWRMVALLCAQTALTALRPKFVASSEQQRHFTGNPFKSDSKEMDQLERRNPSGERKPKEGQNGFVEGGPAPTPKSAVLISGSLSAQHHLFSPNMDDLFFGADELNLFGMNGDSEQALRSLITSGILSMSQLKEEAFDLKRKSSSQKRTPTQHGNSSALQRRTRRKRAESMANGLTASSSIWGTFQRSNRSTIEEDEEPNEEENEEKATPVAIGSSRSTPSSSNQDELDIEEWEKGARGSQQQLPPPTLPTNFDEEPTKTRHKNGYHQQQQQQEDLLKFDPLPTLKALLQFYSNLGDVQMCATVCMVVGERILEKLFSMEQIELWFNAYIELLERLKLWHVASLLIKACYRPKISQLSNESTFVKTWCRNCRNPATKASMRCAKCRQLYNYTCILCETTVRGIWSSCAECGHGGHLQHMEEWFGQSEVCPAVGCGHHCARTSTAV